MALQALGIDHAMLGQYEQAKVYANSCLTHALPLGGIYVMGVACLTLGNILLAQDEYVSAQTWFEQDLATYRKMGQENGQSWLPTRLGYAARGLGNLTQAREYLTEALQICIHANSFLSIALALPGATLLMARTDDVETA
jgi:tetratricopeptide (TPR) repeat protein